jgi:glycosyltransferase involved in cell wall biosynthesis
MRARGIATGLRRSGHAVSVVTAALPDRALDEGGGVEVVALPCPELGRFGNAPGLKWPESVVPGEPLRMPFLRAMVSSVLPDRYAAWVPRAVRATRRLLDDDSVLLTTSARSAHIVGRLAHGRRPWVADVNDLWAFNRFVERRRARDWIEWRMECSTIGRSTAVTTTTAPMAEELDRRHEPTAVPILSGFDSADFDRLAPGPRSLPRRLLFAGTCYWTLDFAPLYEAVRQGLAEGWLDEGNLRISFVGHQTERVGREAEELGIASIVEGGGLLPRDELLERMVNADGLLLPLYDEFTIAMKFYEYVGAGRPIVGYGAPELPTGRLIERHGLGVVVQDAADFKWRLRQLVEHPETLPVPGAEARRAFTWDESIERLNDLLLAAGSPDHPAPGREQRSTASSTAATASSTAAATGAESVSPASQLDPSTPTT